MRIRYVTEPFRLEQKRLCNSRFKLHVHGNGDHGYYHGYIGFDKLCDLVGSHNVINALSMALKHNECTTFHRKIRNGYRIDFYHF